MKKTAIKKAIDRALKLFYSNGYTATGYKFRSELYRQFNLENHLPVNRGIQPERPRYSKVRIKLYGKV